MPLRFVDVVEGVKEFLLNALLAGQELNVIDQKIIDAAVTRSELGKSIFLDGPDEFVGEFLTGYVSDPTGGVAVQGLMGYGMHQMGLTQSGFTIEKKRIVSVSGSVGYRNACRMGKFTPSADDEIGKGVFGVNA